MKSCSAMVSLPEANAKDFDVSCPGLFCLQVRYLISLSAASLDSLSPARGHQAEASEG